MKLYLSSLMMAIVMVPILLVLFWIILVVMVVLNLTDLGRMNKVFTRIYNAF